ncbi:heterokaryon incompatibility protein-domain-containing protein [Lenzites betulinus]|nr:heterokaryon incompatibility protein-domain-containing protein [Lenzites betulinus]
MYATFQRANELPDHPSAPYTKVHAPIIDVGSTESLALARCILRSCENEHERCRNIIISREEAVLPTRLIDCTDPNHPRLVKSSKGQHSQYVTLSYVWGGDQPHKTTRSNLSQYERGLDLALLPQTIRDAIRVTHEFGFKLLWVDSLCIVQDSEDEKQFEIGRMQHIYRYASLTVVAASAQSAADGFLYDRQPLSLRSGISLPILSPQTQRTAEPQIHTLTLFSEYGLPSGVEYRREPISKRAWCLQEHLMSPRSLLFTSKTLQFRCQTATHSIGTSFYNWTSEDRLPDALFLQTPFSSKHDTGDWHTIHNVWNNIVLEYTRRSMTDPSDKLVACAAIAEAFHRVLDSDYLAGLWRHSLLTDLVWYVRGTQPRPAAYRAPSWSWAAVDDELEMINFSHETAFAEVVRCDVSLKEDSIPFGEVTGGSLVLRAQLLRLRLTERDASELQFDPGEQSLRNHRVDDEDDAATYSIRGQDVSWMAWYDFAIDSGDDSDEPSWAIPLGCTYTHMLDGLIVARAQPAASGPNSADSKTLYRRIGCFKSLRCKDTTEHERLLVRPYKNKEVPLQEIEII